MLEIYVSSNILTSILGIFVIHEKNLTGGLILFRPVMRMKYINNCKGVLSFKQMIFFMVYIALWLLGNLIDMVSWGRGIGSLTPGGFCFFMFYVGIKKVFALVQSLHIMYKLHRKMPKKLLTHGLCWEPIQITPSDLNGFSTQAVSQ